LDPYINKIKKREKEKEKIQENKKCLKNIYILPTFFIFIYIYSEKSIPTRPGNCQRLVEKDQIYKIGKFNSAFLTNEGSTGKENSI